MNLHPGDSLVPPWAACAPLRAQMRRMIGLDGTFIILSGKSAVAARRDAAAEG